MKKLPYDFDLLFDCKDLEDIKRFVTTSNVVEVAETFKACGMPLPAFIYPILERARIKFIKNLASIEYLLG